MKEKDFNLESILNIKKKKTKILNKKIYFLNIYGNRIRVKLQNKNNIRYLKLAHSNKIIAFGISKQDILNIAKNRLEIIFERGAITGDFSQWNKLKGKATNE